MVPLIPFASAKVVCLLYPAVSLNVRPVYPPPTCPPAPPGPFTHLLIASSIQTPNPFHHPPVHPDHKSTRPPTSPDHEATRPRRPFFHQGTGLLPPPHHVLLWHQGGRTLRTSTLTLALLEGAERLTRVGGRGLT